MSRKFKFHSSVTRIAGTLHEDWRTVTLIFIWILLRMRNILDKFQINHQPDATNFQFIILTFIYSSTCFGRFPAHHQELNDCSGSLWFYLRIVLTVALCSWSRRPGHEHTTTAVNKRQDNKLKNYWVRLVIYLSCTMMHGLTNLKFYI